MIDPGPAYAEVATRLALAGLLLRGGFHPAPGDGVPALPGGADAGTVLLVGNAGPAMWAAFECDAVSRVAVDPLDRWVREVLGGLAEGLGATVLFPFAGPPYLPFQRWAQRAEPVYPSPIGILIHPDYGLWHAYRGALAFAHTMALPPALQRPSPCESCAAKPCLTACPVGALSAGHYDVPACLDHMTAVAGTACRDDGCRARRACPVGRDHAYPPGQAGFHMAAFIRAQAGATR